MSHRLRSVLTGFAVVCGVAALAAAPQSDLPRLPDLLRAAGAALADYQRDVSALVSEEHYDQIARAGLPSRAVRRILRSDLLVIANPATGWVVFRDVFEVDGRVQRDRDQRLANLFLKPDADTFRQAQRIAEESARFNVNIRGREIGRTLNNPLAALRFLQTQHQHRSRFKAERAQTVDGVPTVEVSFQEEKKPRLLVSPDDAAARGRVWIDRASGRIVRTQLFLDTGPSPAIISKITATFGMDKRVGQWVPQSMDEDYRLGAWDYLTIEARATYSNFRKFNVDVSTVVKDQN